MPRLDLRIRSGSVVLLREWMNRFQWVSLVFLSISVLAQLAWADGWEKLTEDDGVVVSRKAVPGRSLPIFRGIVTYKESIYDVLAVLDDVALRTKWVHRCIESKMLKKVSDFSRIIYNRTDAPWPVSDRDVVVQSKAIVDPKLQPGISFTLENYRPKRSGVVRILAMGFISWRCWDKTAPV